MDLFYFNESEARIIKEMIDSFMRRNQQESTIGPPPDISDDMFPPEVYVAKIPFGGIPALQTVSGSPIPGSATCDIYKLWPYTGTGTGSGEEELIAAAFDQTVYNLSSSVVSGEYKIVWREKFGNWITENCPCSI